MGLTQSPHLPTDFSQQAQIEALAQQVQELRQALIYLLNPFSATAVRMSDPVAGDFSIKLGNYPKFGG